VCRSGDRARRGTGDTGQQPITARTWATTTTSASRAGWRPPHGGVVAPTSARPTLAVYADLQPVQPSHLAINALRLTVTGPDGSRIQPFATLVQVQIAGPDHRPPATHCGG
jgi:hypothetical protein